MNRPDSPYNYPHHLPEVEAVAQQRAAANTSSAKMMAWLLGWTGIALVSLAPDNRKTSATVWLILGWVFILSWLSIVTLGGVPLLLWVASVVAAHSDGFHRDRLAQYRWEEECAYTEYHRRQQMIGGSW